MAQVVLPNSIDAATPAVASEVQGNFVALRNTINGDLEGGTVGNLKANGVGARELADDVVRWAPGQYLQEGVVGAGHGKVTPGSGLVLNYAAADAYVLDDSGVISSGALIPILFGGATVTIAANASGNPRIDQVIATMTGYRTATVSVLQGTATAGATLANRNGAAGLSNDSIRLADILMPNGFAGPFVQNTHIRDRRPWARGAYRVLGGSGSGAYSTSSVSMVLVDSLFQVRIEEGGTGFIELNFNFDWVHTVNGGVALFGFARDGSVIKSIADVSPVNTASQAVHLSWTITAQTGSHLYEVYFSTATGATLSINNTGSRLPVFTLHEKLIQNSDNAGA